jgi:fructose 5-dehydrogenase small subunit
MKRSRPCAATSIPGLPNRTTRRTFLLASAVVTAGVGMTTDRRAALAQQSTTAGLDDADFLRLSKAVTGHTDLDATIASRLLIALRNTDPTFVDHAAGLFRLVRDGQTPEALLGTARASGLHDTMLTLVAAWYTGTVGHGPQAEMVSYVDALMYRPVSDGLPVPTYCLNGPLWWPGPPPAAGVSAPSGTPVTPPPPAETPKGG